jgi:hypothetical protein
VEKGFRRELGAIFSSTTQIPHSHLATRPSFGMTPGANPQSSILNPQPSILNPQSSTLNPSLACQLLWLSQGGVFVDEKKEWNGGKFPNRGGTGMALSEFVDESSNAERTGPDNRMQAKRDEQGNEVERAPSPGLGFLVLPIAGILAGVVAAVSVVMFIRPRRKRANAPYDEYGNRRIRPSTPPRGRFTERL